MAYSKIFLLATLCLGASVGAPQNLVRLVPADIPLRAIPADTVESHAVHSVHHDAPVITRLIPGSPALTQIVPAETRFVQPAPVVTRLVQAAPALAPVIPAAPVAQVVRQAAPIAVRTVVDEQVEAYDPNPQYNFGYSVADTITGDSKTREEKRDGDVVSGSYTIADPDGRIRRVVYTADSVNGFQAQVTYDGQDGPVAIPIDAPIKPAIATQSAIVESNNNVAIVEARAPTVVQSAAPAVVRTEEIHPVGHFVAQPAGLVRSEEIHPVGHIVAQPAGLVRNVVQAQPTLIQIDGSDQTFQLTPFGLRGIPAGARITQVVHAPNGDHLVQA